MSCIGQYNEMGGMFLGEILAAYPHKSSSHMSTDDIEFIHGSSGRDKVSKGLCICG